MRHRCRKWAVFVSGRGSNLQALLGDPDYGKVVLVVSNSKTAPALLRARRAGVRTFVSQPLDWQAIQAQLEASAVDHIFLAGFMRIIPEAFVKTWEGKMLNIHPSLLPAYPGLNSIVRAYDDGAKIGATVHAVTPIVDAGRIIVQRQVWPGVNLLDRSLDAMTLRVHFHEHHLVRQALKQWVGGVCAERG